MDFSMRSIKAFFNAERNHTLKRCKYSFAMKSTSTFGERLEEALSLAKKDRQQLANALGISVQALSQVIVGKTKALTAENAARAAQELGVDVMWLSTGDGEPTVTYIQTKNIEGGKTETFWPFRVPMHMLLQLPPEQLRALDTVIWTFCKELMDNAGKEDFGKPAPRDIIPAPEAAPGTKRAKHG